MGISVESRINGCPSWMASIVLDGNLLLPIMPISLIRMNDEKGS